MKRLVIIVGSWKIWNKNYAADNFFGGVLMVIVNGADHEWKSVVWVYAIHYKVMW